jgi:hypothetical protein
MIYSDGLADVDIQATIAFHRAHGKLVSGEVFIVSGQTAETGGPSEAALHHADRAGRGASRYLM